MELKSMLSSNPGRTRLRGRLGALRATVVCALMIPSFAIVAGFWPVPASAEGDSVPVAELMAGEVLPDLAIGSNNAPITIVEYASMTCGHCAAFYTTTFPELKSKYIDT